MGCCCVVCGCSHHCWSFVRSKRGNGKSSVIHGQSSSAVGEICIGVIAAHMHSSTRTILNAWKMLFMGNWEERLLEWWFFRPVIGEWWPEGLRPAGHLQSHHGQGGKRRVVYVGLHRFVLAVGCWIFLLLSGKVHISKKEYDEGIMTKVLKKLLASIMCTDHHWSITTNQNHSLLITTCHHQSSPITANHS